MIILKSFLNFGVSALVSYAIPSTCHSQLFSKLSESPVSFLWILAWSFVACVSPSSVHYCIELGIAYRVLVTYIKMLDTSYVPLQASSSQEEQNLGKEHVAPFQIFLVEGPKVEIQASWHKVCQQEKGIQTAL